MIKEREGGHGCASVHLDLGGSKIVRAREAEAGREFQFLEVKWIYIFTNDVVRYFSNSNADGCTQ